MASESESTSRGWSNRRGGGFAPKKIPTPRERISFRDLAKFAQRDKTVAWLVDVTGKDESTVKRYLSKRYEPPASVVTAVLSDIVQRLEFKNPGGNP